MIPVRTGNDKGGLTVGSLWDVSASGFNRPL